MNKVVAWFKNVTQQLENIRGQNDELIWADIFNSTIKNSSWFSESVSPGRWAVGYPVLYVLYRVLNDVNPQSILELGLGQSSKLTCSYAHSHDGVNHVIVDHDQDWIDFFVNNIKNISDKTDVIRCDLTKEMKQDYEHISYVGFKEALPNCKFDCILVDAPFGSKHDSRNDILSIIPNALAENFCIIFDDFERTGEKETVQKVKKCLKDNGIEFCEGTYTGVKSMHIVVSKNMKFLCSL